jgi:hypothetical protein
VPAVHAAAADHVTLPGQHEDAHGWHGAAGAGGGEEGHVKTAAAGCERTWL